MATELIIPLATETAKQPFLPFSAPWFGDEEKNEILQTLESDWITTGPRTKSFEKKFADYIGISEAVAVNSCTAALHLALAAIGVGPRDAVITSPLTFAATANVIVHQGAQPIFIDIDPETYNLDPDKLVTFIQERCRWDSGSGSLRVKKTNKRVRAIIAVHYAGHPCDMDKINACAREFRLTVIEDAAHALGATYFGRNVGTLGDVGCFSFYPTKNISTGEGGMLTTKDPELAQRVRMLSLHGISRDAWNRYGPDGSWRYDILEAGFKYNMTDLSAALGLHQLDKLPGFLRRRAELAKQYQSVLAGLPLKHPTVLPEVDSAWHLYPVQVQSPWLSREQLIVSLRGANIGSSVHFIPLHLMSYYQRRFGYRLGDFPVAEGVFNQIVSLPFFPRMSDSDVERVGLAMRAAFAELMA
ncbi:MAG: UDP-4-amino-4,6-dideoxy-N-acetyl-beta-L-altrosamine transaminase [Acidobacteria bacterium]|nr:MAG: UDP-4-amino-4,6-dideoxy-N-acetyl-beta-L-altrosamine transaminase [Acidobacteriota bacterium]